MTLIFLTPKIVWLGSVSMTRILSLLPMFISTFSRTAIVRGWLCFRVSVNIFFSIKLNCVDAVPHCCKIFSENMEVLAKLVFEFILLTFKWAAVSFRQTSPGFPEILNQNNASHYARILSKTNPLIYVFVLKSEQKRQSFKLLTHMNGSFKSVPKI